MWHQADTVVENSWHRKLVFATAETISVPVKDGMANTGIINPLINIINIIETLSKIRNISRKIMSSVKIEVMWMLHL